MFNKILHLGIAVILTMPAFADAVTIQLPATGQTICYDSGGGVIDCAGTGQDGEFLAGTAWPAPRFVVNGDTATDTLTGLMWTRDGNAPDPNGPAPAAQACPNSRNDMSWQEGLDYLACLNTAAYLGFTDWRLPNLNELESLVDADAVDSSLVLNNAGFANVQASTYWSATSDALDMNSAWDVSLRTGDFQFSSIKVPVVPADDTRGVWPVRGSSAGPAQIWRTGQTGCFDELGVARACPAAEDGAVTAGAAWPAPRFVANAGATYAADRLTGLIWPADTQTAGPAAACFTGSLVSWQNALTHVQCLNANSYLGISAWRLPNTKELRSLVDYSQSLPALPADHAFTNIALGEPFWTSTTDAAQSDRAWTIGLANGHLNGVPKDSSLHVLPVSGPDAVLPALTITAVSTPTRLTTQTLTGTVESGITPVISAGITVGAVSVNGTNWSAALSGMTEGTHDVTVTATDLAGNSTTAATAITVNLPTGSFTAGGTANVTDALKALRIAVGLVTPTAADMLHGDVEPLGAPDDDIDVNDALLILKKAVGLVSF